MQLKIIDKRLETHTATWYAAADKIKSNLNDFDSQKFNVEDYFLYRCATFRNHCADLARSMANNLVFSKTRIDVGFFTNLLRAEYIFGVLSSREKSTGFKVKALVNINNGEISFSKGNSKAAENNDATRPEYEDITAVYKNDSSSMSFISAGFTTCEFPQLERLFSRPFRVDVSIRAMNNWILQRKIEIVLGNLQYLKEEDLKGLSYLSSLAYYEKYPFCTLVRENEPGEVDMATLLDEFLRNVPDVKKTALINIMLNILPGTIKFLNIHKFASLPDYYLIVWAEKYLDSYK